LQTVLKRIEQLQLKSLFFPLLIPVIDAQGDEYPDDYQKYFSDGIEHVPAEFIFGEKSLPYFSKECDH
jgi:hypothetical protein